MRLYFDWANDPDTRRQSFNSAPILLEEHARWFSSKLCDPNTLLLIFESEAAEPVSQVRFEKQSDGRVIIGISIDKKFRGLGLASQLIQQACNRCRQHWGSVVILAYIKPENQASIRAFLTAGFIEPEMLRWEDIDAIRLENLSCV